MGTISTVSPQMGGRRPQRIGTLLQWFGTVTMTSSYATNGDTLTAAELGLDAIEGAVVGNAGGYVFEAVRTPGSSDIKIKAYRQKDPGNAGGADIPLPEVGNAVDLSAIKPSIHVWGH